MVKDDILRKIKDLLALGDKARNNSEEEAKAAMLMAQKLMAKYDISAEEVEGEEEEQYAHEMCEHKWDYAYRVPLANVLSKNFRCMVYFRGKSVVFMGHPSDAKICKATFEFAYKFIQKKGNALYNKKYAMGYPTKGVFNSYAHGFIVGLQEAFDIQCQALAIVTPPDVIDEFTNLSKNWGTKNSKDISKDVHDYQTWREGRRDGKKFMDKEKLPE
jgi:hypothetical protein